MKIDLSTLKNPVETYKLTTMLKDTQGNWHGIMGSMKTLVNETIRLCNGHNWKIVYPIRKRKGILTSDGDFYPYPEDQQDYYKKEG